MNPFSQRAADNTFEPMIDVSKNLKISWYRCPVDKSVLRDLMKPDDKKGLFHAIGHLGLWGVLGAIAFYTFIQEMWIGFFVALFLQGIVASFFTAPHHELCHKTVFKTKWLNDFFLYIFALLGWQNFRIYQFSHNYHHRFTLHIEGDREEVMPATPSLRLWYLIQLFTINITGGYQSKAILPTLINFTQIASDRFDNPYNSWGSELYEGCDEHRIKARDWARVVLLFHAVVIGVSFAIGHPILALLISGSVFIANAHRYFIGTPMHCGLKHDNADFRKCVRTITLDPLSEFLYWHMNWHLEHHMFAGVPCYNLEKLYHATAKDMPKPRTLWGAWQEMRETWHRQKTDPDYAFDTFVPSPAINKIKPDDKLEASVGEIDQRASAQ